MRILEICTLRQFILIILHWIFQFCICVIIFYKEQEKEAITVIFRWGITWQQAKEGKPKLASNHKRSHNTTKRRPISPAMKVSNGLHMGCVLVLGGVPAALCHFKPI